MLIVYLSCKIEEIFVWLYFVFVFKCVEMCLINICFSVTNMCSPYVCSLFCFLKLTIKVDNVNGKHREILP
jgi:hypothetical protein